MGVIEFLLNNQPNQLKQFLLGQFVFKIIPMINPDGVERGHFRLDPHGLDLNRYYQKPDKFLQPTVYAITQLLSSWKKDNRVFFFCDFHSHGLHKNCYFYGNYLGFVMQVETRAFAKMMSIVDPNFNYNHSIFSHKHMGKIDNSKKNTKDKKVKAGKEGSARVYAYRTCHILHSYTLELGYHQNVLTPDTPNPEPYMISTYKAAGQNLLVCIAELFKKSTTHPSLLISEFKTLAGIREKVSLELKEKYKKKESHLLNKINNIHEMIESLFYYRNIKLTMATETCTKESQAPAQKITKQLSTVELSLNMHQAEKEQEASEKVAQEKCQESLPSNHEQSLTLGTVVFPQNQQLKEVKETIFSKFSVQSVPLQKPRFLRDNQEPRQLSQLFRIAESQDEDFVNAVNMCLSVTSQRKIDQIAPNHQSSGQLDLASSSQRRLIAELNVESQEQLQSSRHVDTSHLDLVQKGKYENIKKLVQKQDTDSYSDIQLSKEQKSAEFNLLVQKQHPKQLTLKRMYLPGPPDINEKRISPSREEKQITDLEFQSISAISQNELIPQQAKQLRSWDINLRSTYEQILKNQAVLKHHSSGHQQFQPNTTSTKIKKLGSKRNFQLQDQAQYAILKDKKLDQGAEHGRKVFLGSQMGTRNPKSSNTLTLSMNPYSVKDSSLNGIQMRANSISSTNQLNLSGLNQEAFQKNTTIKAKKQLLVQYQPYKTNLGHPTKNNLNKTGRNKKQQKLDSSKDYHDIFTESTKRMPSQFPEDAEVKLLAPIKSVKDLRSSSQYVDQPKNFFDLTMGSRLPNLNKPVSTIMRGIVSSLHDQTQRQLHMNPKELSSRVREQISKEYAYMRVDGPQQSPQTPTQKEKNRSGTRIRSKEAMTQLNYKALNFPHYKAGDFPGNTLVDRNYRHQIYFQKGDITQKSQISGQELG